MASTVFPGLVHTPPDPGAQASRPNDVFGSILIDNFPEGTITVLDRDLRILTVGGRGLVVFGVTPGQLTGRLISEVTPAEMCAVMEHYYRRALLGTTEKFEIRHNSDYYSITVGPLFDSEGRVSSLLAVTLNITEKKHSELEVLKHGLLLRSLQSATEILLTDEDPKRGLSSLLYAVGQYIDADRLFILQSGSALLYGEQPHDRLFLWQRSLQTVQITPSDASLVALLAQQATGSGGHTLLQFRRPDSAPDTGFPADTAMVSCLAVPVHTQDGIWGYIGIEDCSATRQWSTVEESGLTMLAHTMESYLKGLAAENRLRSSEEQSRAIISALPDVLYVLDTTGTILDVKTSDLPRLPAPPERLIGTAMSAVFPRELCTRILDAGAEVLADGGVRVFDFAGESGTNRYCEARIVPFGGTILLIVRDISKRKQAEEALRENERMLLTLMSNLPGMVYRCRADNQWTTEFISEGCTTITGYQPSDLLHNHRVSFASLIHPDDRDMVRREVLAALAQQQPYRMIFRLIHASGEERWMWEQGRGVYNESGHLAYLEGFITDITDFRRTEQALAASEARLQRAESLSTVMVAHVTPDGQWQRVPAKLCALLGYAEEELTAMPVDAVRHPADVAAGTRERLRLIAGQTSAVELEERYIRRDGSVVWTLVSSSLVSDERGTPLYVLCYIQDITSRKIAEEQVRASGAQLLGIMESTHDSVFSLDLDLRYTAFNSTHHRNIKRLYGVDIAIGMSIMEYLATSSQKDEVLAALERAQHGEQFRAEFQYGTDPDTVYNEFTFNPITGDNGRTVGVAVFIRNITERKRAEEQLSRSYEDLELRVRERTADLEHALRQLHEALAAEKELSELKTRFVSMVSHEFRTPLTSILSSVEILERYRDRLDPRQQTRFYFMITESVRRMSSLLEDVILLGRAESNNLHFHPEYLRPENYCRELLEELHLGFLRDRTVHLAVEGVPREALVDPQLLRYILTNLLSNAVKYSPRHEPVSLTLSFGTTTLVFQVADRGIGISPEDMKHIFEPFYRSTQVETIQGTGLGLSIVKQSVARHGGVLEVEQNAAGGTTFTVRLPA